MINKVVDELPNTLSFYYHYTKNSAIELIFQPDWMLLESIVENLQKFKSEMSAKLKQKEAKIMVDEKASTSQSGLEAALDSLQNNKLTYIENIRKRSDYLFMSKSLSPLLRRLSLDHLPGSARQERGGAGLLVKSCFLSFLFLQSRSTSPRTAC